MSALRMIAWGMVDFDNVTPKEFQALRKQVRDELRNGTNLRLVGWAGNLFVLHARPNTGERKRIKRYKSKPQYRGTLQECCREAFRLLYPEVTQ